MQTELPWSCSSHWHQILLDLQGSSSHKLSMVKVLWNCPKFSCSLSDCSLWCWRTFFLWLLSATWSLIFVKIKFLDTSIKQQCRELSANHPRRKKPLWQGGVRGECHQLSQRTWLSEDGSGQGMFKGKLRGGKNANPTQSVCLPRQAELTEVCRAIGRSSWAHSRLPKVS